MVPPSSHEGAAKALAEELQELSECPQRGQAGVTCVTAQACSPKLAVDLVASRVEPNEAELTA